MLKFVFIGLGQSGGNFVNEAKKFGYSALAINTASIDLETLGSLENTEKMHLVGYEGAGKDRSVGREAFMENKDRIAEHIQTLVEGAHVIFPVAALGGGTGSGMVQELIHYLSESYEEKVISPILFLPAKGESTRSRMNALEAFSEISLIEGTGACFCIDNSRIMERNSDVPINEKYERAYRQIIGLLNHFNTRTETRSIIANLDKMDLLTVLSERGCAYLSGFGIGEDHITDSEKIKEKLANSWEISYFAETEINIIPKAAMVVDLPNQMTKNLFVDAFFEENQKPLEIFSGIYESHDARLYNLVTGLPYPVRLLKQMEEGVHKEEKEISYTLEKVRTQTFDVKTNWTDSLKRKRKVRV